MAAVSPGVAAKGGGAPEAAGSRVCGEVLGIAAAAASRDVDWGEAGASAGANGPSDWLQEAAAKPSAAQISGRKILIMGAL